MSKTGKYEDHPLQSYYDQPFPNRIERILVSETVKMKFDELCREYRDIKKLYFVDRALMEAIEKEWEKRKTVSP